MSRSDTHTFTLKRVVAAGVAGALAAALSASAAQASPPVPDALEVEKGHHLFLKAHAVGVQSYACTATAGGHAWTFVAPTADLFHAQGRQIGSHYAGPTWEWADGSTVKASRVDGVTVDPTAIPWLLLRASPGSEGPTGGDRLVPTTFIQRVNTTGGIAPAAALCNAATVGSQADVPYTADYLFFRQSGR